MTMRLSSCCSMVLRGQKDLANGAHSPSSGSSAIVWLRKVLVTLLHRFFSYFKHV